MKLVYCPLAVVLVLPLALTAAAADFDFFLHVQKWPGSFCDARADRCCFPGNQKPVADFSIHGLWPNYASCRRSGSLLSPEVPTRCWPDFCNPKDPLNTSLSSADMAKIKDMESELLRNWGTLSCRNKNATDLWSHQWRKHGTCSGMDQHAYFRAALDFKARFNLTRILLDAGIAPSNKQTYYLSSVQDAVTKATGSAPTVECTRNRRHEMQLYQVFQCVDRNGKNPVHCPRHLESRCPDKIKFPVFYATGRRSVHE